MFALALPSQQGPSAHQRSLHSLLASLFANAMFPPARMHTHRWWDRFSSSQPLPSSVFKFSSDTIVPVVLQPELFCIKRKSKQRNRVEKAERLRALIHLL